MEGYELAVVTATLLSVAGSSWRGTWRCIAEIFALLNMQNAAGRRGEDLRSIQLANMYEEHISNIKPAPLHAVGATIYTVKERKDPVETLISFVRTKVREECPVAATAAYLVFLNDIYGLQLLSTIKNDLMQLKELVEKVCYCGRCLLKVLLQLGCC